MWLRVYAWPSSNTDTHFKVRVQSLYQTTHWRNGCYSYSKLRRWWYGWVRATDNCSHYLVVFSFPSILEHGITKFFILWKVKVKVKVKWIGCCDCWFCTINTHSNGSDFFLLTIKFTPVEVNSFIWVSETSRFSSLTIKQQKERIEYLLRLNISIKIHSRCNIPYNVSHPPQYDKGVKKMGGCSISIKPPSKLWGNVVMMNAHW